MIGNYSNLLVIICLLPSSSSSQATFLSLLIMLCGSNIGTTRTGMGSIFVCFEARFAIVLAVMLVFASWLARVQPFKQLDCCVEHNANSHDEDKSKFLKYEQIIAVTDAVTVAPTLSAAQLRRNMQLADPNSPRKRIDRI